MKTLCLFILLAAALVVSAAPDISFVGKNTTNDSSRNPEKTKVVLGEAPEPPLAALNVTRQAVAEILGIERDSPTITTFPREMNTNQTMLEAILKELKEMNGLFKQQMTMLSCPPPFFRMGLECLYVILQDMSFETARSKCQEMGADLVVPADIKRLKVYVGTRYPRKNMRNFWIGGKINDKLWRWFSGDLIDERLWHTNEPSGNGECLAMFDGWEHPLTDYPCENERRAICERDIDV